jgi:hypothetical protein
MTFQLNYYYLDWAIFFKKRHNKPHGFPPSRESSSDEDKYTKRISHIRC